MKYDFDLEDHSKKRKEIFLRVLLCALEIGVVLFVAYAITHFGLEKMTVSGKYMSPTLKDGDEILINKMCYRLHKVRRNDVVVVKHNGAQHNYYTVERVIGLPGEKVQIKNGRIYVNGKKTKAFSNQKILSAGLAADEITLKSKQYFVVGDNYNNSEDSRSASVGNIKRTNIIGKVGIKYWPW